MTHFQQKHENTFAQLLRGLPAVLVAAMFVLVVFMGVLLNKTSTRVTVLEARLAELVEVSGTGKIIEAPDVRSTTGTLLPAEKDIRLELERSTKDLEKRVDQRIRAGREAPGQAVMETRLLAEPTQVEVVSEDSSEADPIVRIEGMDEEQLYSAALKSMYSSLKLSPEREAELGTGIEEMLDIIWPEFVAHQRSPDADSTALKQLYCDEAWSILTSEEAGRLGC